MYQDLLNNIQETFLIRKINGMKPITTGNINSTFKVEAEGAKYILQKINKDVFTRPEEIMQNIRRINRYLEKKVLFEGGDPSKEVLHPIDTLDGSRFLIDKNGDYWRMYDWIEDAKTYDNMDTEDKEKAAAIFHEAGRAFGKFQKRLANYPAENLHEAIPDFHNTPKRYADFEIAIAADKVGRLKEIEGQDDHPLNIAVKMISDSKEEIQLLEIGKKTGKLPIRVTHNDTKINNVMIDNKTGEAICVIDLDTVGPDTALVDFGDAIRSGANPVGEEPENIEDALMDIRLFEAYVEGYLNETLVTTEEGKLNNDPKIGLTKNEVALLHKAPRILTLELAMRFLGDYINGDEYFKIKEGQREDINLHRGLVQLHLAEDMKAKEDKMKKIVNLFAQEKVKKDRQNNKKEIQIEEK